MRNPAILYVVVVVVVGAAVVVVFGPPKGILFRSTRPIFVEGGVVDRSIVPIGVRRGKRPPSTTATVAIVHVISRRINVIRSPMRTLLLLSRQEGFRSGRRRVRPLPPPWSSGRGRSRVSGQIVDFFLEQSLFFSIQQGVTDSFEHHQDQADRSDRLGRNHGRHHHQMGDCQDRVGAIDQAQ